MRWRDSDRRIPVNNGAHDQIESGRSERLAVVGPITDFSALMEKDCAFQLVSGFALVDTSLKTQPKRALIVTETNCECTAIAQI